MIVIAVSSVSKYGLLDEGLRVIIQICFKLILLSVSFINTTYDYVKLIQYCGISIFISQRQVKMDVNCSMSYEFTQTNN